MIASIVEMYIDRFALFRGTKSEFREELTQMAIKCRDFGINSNIRFFNRIGKRKQLKENAVFNTSFKNLQQSMEDLFYNNREFWKRHIAQYNYFHKDVPRR